MQHTSNPSEIWKPVVGYEGLYEVSDHGRVRSLDREVRCGVSGSRTVKARVLKQSKDHSGYRMVGLSKNGLSTKRVHRLVLEAFVGPAPKGTECCHGDSNPENNALGNLRWDTAKGNQRDTIQAGRGNVGKKFCPRGHSLELPNLVLSTRKDGRRSCLSCARARARVHTLKKRNGFDTSGQLQEIADSYYEKLLATMA